MLSLKNVYQTSRKLNPNISQRYLTLWRSHRFWSKRHIWMPRVSFLRSTDGAWNSYPKRNICIWRIVYLKARFLKQNYFTKGKKLQELWSFLHFRWLHICHPQFSRLSTYSWPPHLRHRIYELSICKFHSCNHWMWHLQGQKCRRLYLQTGMAEAGGGGQGTLYWNRFCMVIWGC